LKRSTQYIRQRQGRKFIKHITAATNSHPTATPKLHLPAAQKQPAIQPAKTSERTPQNHEYFPLNRTGNNRREIFVQNHPSGNRQNSRQNGHRKLASFRKNAVWSPHRDTISVTVPFTRRAAFLSTGLGLFSLRAAPAPSRNLKVAIFSKHLQFLQGAELARAAAEIGFDGIDLTVRSGGHIEPARAAEDLPPLVALIRQYRLDVPMVTTDIVDSDTPHARAVLKTIANLGIRHYRWGGFKYAPNQPIAEQIQAFHKRSAALAALNAEYQVCAMYHTHSGVDLVGAPVWDMVEILKSLDPSAVGINYDIGHATVEGGLGGWIDSFRIAQPYIRGIAVKDFLWQKDKTDYQPAWVPLGEGMVRFPAFFSMLAQTPFDGPLQLHFEYPLFGADAGKRQLTADPTAVFSAMRRDLRKLRDYLKNAGFAHA